METARPETTWFAIDDASSVGAARRAAIGLAERLNFDDGRIGEVGIVASEIATNVHRHGDRGTVGIQVALRGGVAGVEIVAVDSGPGMSDVASSRLDGHTTAGTLGVGLGAIERLSSSSDVMSVPGRGTVFTARLWPAEEVKPDRDDIGGLTRPTRGEDVCGDRVAARTTGEHQLLLAVDGLGHGPLAAVASQETLRIFLATDEMEPAALLETIHRGISHTRGAAVAIARIDPGFDTVVLAGTGNISAFVCGPQRRQAMISYPGIVGHNVRSVRQLAYAVPSGAVIVLHSDGMREAWSLNDQPGLSRRTSTVIAGVLLRDHAVRRDDASVLVARRAA